MPVTRIPRRRRRHRRRGAAAVEFAIVLPLLMTIVLACVDFGRFAYAYIAVSNAARSGAGFASFHPYTPTTRALWEEKTRETVRTEMGAEFDASKVEVPPLEVSTDEDGLQRVRVEVSYPFETLVAWPLLPNNLTLTRAVDMRFIR